MKYTDKKILIFGAGGRQALPVCKGFFSLGCKVYTYCSSKLSTGFLTKYKTEAILYEGTQGEFFSHGVELIERNKYDLVVPLGDVAAEFLSKNKENLEKYSKIAVNYPNIQQYALNKSMTMRVCNDNNIPAPRTITDITDLDELCFPVVVKPISGVGSVGFNIFQSKDALEDYFGKYDDRFGKLLIQEYIEQGNSPQYRADLFRNKNGNYSVATVGKVTRWYPLDGGSGIHVVTVHNEEIINNCKKLLDIIDWNGYANIDLVYDQRTNQAKIVEINGRTGASIKIDYLAGINISQAILENELGDTVTDMLKYPDGVEVSCFLPDLLWLLKSKKSFAEKKTWFKRKKIKDTIFSFDDPLPGLGFCIKSLFEYKQAMEKRKRTKP